MDLHAGRTVENIQIFTGIGEEAIKRFII